MTVTFSNRRQTDVPTSEGGTYYVFAVGTRVKIISIPGAQPEGYVVARYTSDEHNHAAQPHKRYVIKCGSGPKCCIADVSEHELVRLG